MDWKGIVDKVKEKCPKVKVPYVRSDAQSGEIAVSKHKLQKATLDGLLALKLEHEGHEFVFRQLDGEDLEKFWGDHGGHYQYCIKPKMRTAKKFATQLRQKKSKAKAEKAKAQYEIAGVIYADINKVKSKARAILNLKKDGEALTGNDEEFMKQLIKQHEKHGLKMKNFVKFEVGQHPEHEKTRCFFVVRKDDTKEDFSVSKCIRNLEAAT